MLDPAQFAENLIKTTMACYQANNLMMSLSELLTPLLGTSRQSTLEEYALRLHLKQVILTSAVHLLHDNIQSPVHVRAALAITLTLTAFRNIWEANRILTSTMYFKHSTEYCLRETTLLQDLNTLVENFLKTELEAQTQQAETMCLCI